MYLTSQQSLVLRLLIATIGVGNVLVQGLSIGGFEVPAQCTTACTPAAALFNSCSAVSCLCTTGTEAIAEECGNCAIPIDPSLESQLQPLVDNFNLLCNSLPPITFPPIPTTTTTSIPETPTTPTTTPTTTTSIPDTPITTPTTTTSIPDTPTTPITTPTTTTSIADTPTTPITTPTTTASIPDTSTETPISPIVTSTTTPASSIPPTVTPPTTLSTFPSSTTSTFITTTTPPPSTTPLSNRAKTNPFKPDNISVILFVGLILGML